MSIETGATALPHCTRCGAALAIAGVDPGTWMTCPSCGRPFRVAGAPTDPVRPLEVEAIDLQPGAAHPPSVVERATPRRPRRRRSPVLILTMVSGLSTMLFAGLFLPMASPQELLGTGLYGALLGLFVATMSAAAARVDDGRFTTEL